MLWKDELCPNLWIWMSQTMTYDCTTTAHGKKSERADIFLTRGCQWPPFFMTQCTGKSCRTVGKKMGEFSAERLELPFSLLLLRLPKAAWVFHFWEIGKPKSLPFLHDLFFKKKVKRTFPIRLLIIKRWREKNQWLVRKFIGSTLCKLRL